MSEFPKMLYRADAHRIVADAAAEAAATADQFVTHEVRFSDGYIAPATPETLDARDQRIADLEAEVAFLKEEAERLQGDPKAGKLKASADKPVD